MIRISHQELAEEELWYRVTGKKKPIEKSIVSFINWQKPIEKEKTIFKTSRNILFPKIRILSTEGLVRERLYRTLNRMILESKPENPLEKRVRNLEMELKEVKSLLEQRTQISKTDLIYEKFKEELESKHFGKIAAIDIESQTVVSIGDSVLDAFQRAKSKSSKKKFSYKRIGYPYVFKL